METEKSLVKVSEVRLPKFVEQAYDTIDGMKQFANMLLESKLVPDSYYEKGPDNKPDYNKGKTSAVVVVLLQAQQLAVPPMTALQHIVPVNGLLSIKGDLAKTMIFASGKLRKDSWKEVVTGTIEEENMMVSITATREDNGITLTRTFSVDKAKRMGLWITPAMAGGQDGWKHKKSAWYKTPDRMLFYRCLGNLARDLFSDVLLNMYTTEEAVDIARDTTEIIETEGGAKITIPDKEHAKQRSGKMTERVSDKIPDGKFGEVKKDAIQDAVIVPEKKETEPKPEPKQPEFVPQRGTASQFQGEMTNTMKETIQEPPKEENPGEYTLKGLEAMDTAILLGMVNGDMDMMEGSEMIGGKNTNKKLRGIIFAHQNGRLAEYVAENLPKETTTETPVDTTKGEIPINKSFDSQGTEPVQEQIDAFLDDTVKKEEIKADSGNKYNIEIPERIEGTQREFSTVKSIFNKMMGVEPQITTVRFMDLSTKLGMAEKYPDKEKFIREASSTEINLLLNSN